MTFNISRSSTIVLLRIYSFVTTNCAFTIFITINLKKLTNETIIFKNFVYSILNYAVNLLNNFTHEFKFDIIKLNSSSQISSSTFFHDSRQWIKKFQSIQFLPIQNKLSTLDNRNFYFESNHERMVERDGLCASQTLIRVPSTTRHRYLGRPGGHSFTVYNEAVQLQRQCEGGSIGRFKGHRTIKRMAGQPRFLESSSTKWTMSLCGIGGDRCRDTRNQFHAPGRKRRFLYALVKDDSFSSRKFIGGKVTRFFIFLK